ncbi:hypothetical protein, partial [Caryophanon latum]|uniref:hypothetical protein n=1 Tax=Caryophanon latum TaxID=33977 RepID=UPI001B7FF5E2
MKNVRLVSLLATVILILNMVYPGLLGLTYANAQNETTRSAGAGTDGLSYAGNYYNDVPDARSNLLGAAQNFHIFAESVKISAHTNGNIATKMLETAGSNWGTNVKGNAELGSIAAEIHYIQDFKDFHGNPIVLRGDYGVKLVVGSDIELSNQNNSEFFLKSKHMSDRKKIDNFKADNVYKVLHKEQAGAAPYIDFDAEYKKLYAQTKTLATIGKGITIIFDEHYKGAGKIIKDGVETPFNSSEIDQNEWNNNKTNNQKLAELAGVSTADFEKATVINVIDMNSRKVDLSNAEAYDGYVYVTLPLEMVTASQPIYFEGLETEAFNRDIIINVDTKGADTTIQSQIQLKYKDGSSRTPHETELFSNSTILWNFVDSTKDDYVFTGKLHAGNTVQGSILAPGSDFTSGQNIDGSIIVKTFSGSTGETHRWDFQGDKEVFLTPKVCENVEVSLVDVANGTKVTVNETTYTVADGKITLPSTLAGDLYEVKVGDSVVGEIIISGDCTAVYTSNGETPPTSEAPKTGELNVEVEFIEAVGCEKVTVTLKTAEGNQVEKITVGETIYGITADQVVVDGTLYEVTEQDGKKVVEVDSKQYDVTAYDIEMTESTPTATFTNLLPGEYKVETKQSTCIVPTNPENPAVTVDPENSPTVKFEETKEEPKTGNIEVPVTFIGGAGCTENGDVTVTLKDEQGNTVQKVTVADKDYGILNGKVIVDGTVYEVVAGKVTINDTELTATDYVQTVTKTGAAEETVTTTFTNLVPGNYTVSVGSEECIVPTEENPGNETPGTENPGNENLGGLENPEEPTTPPSVTVEVPPGERVEVPFEETRSTDEPTTSTVKVPVTFAEGKGCLEDGAEVTVTLLTKDGKAVQTITAQDGTVYGVYNNEAIIGGKVVAVEISEGATTVTVNGADYTVGTAVQTVTKAAAKTVEVVFENLVPGEYTVVVEADDCIVPVEEEPENLEDPTTVNVPPGKTEEVPFEETPPTCLQSVKVPENVPSDSTVTIGDKEVPVTEVPTDILPGTYTVKDKDGNEIGEITVVPPTDENPCTSIEFTSPVCTTFELQVTIDGQLVPVTTPVKLVSTTNSTASVTAQAGENGIVTYNDPFTLVPGDYKVVINDVEYGTVTVPSYDKETCETTIFNNGGAPEVPSPTEEPGHIEVPVTFIGGAGCTENGDVTVTLKDEQGNTVQKVTVADKDYGILNGKVIVDGTVYEVVESKVTINDTELTATDYVQTVTKTGAAKETVTTTFTNLVPGNYTVSVVDNEECIVSTEEKPEEPTTRPSVNVNVPPGEKEVVPFEETPKELGTVKVPVQFAGGLGCLEDGSVTVSLTSNGEEVQKITIGDKTYGVTAGQAVVDGKAYVVKDGVITIGDKTYTPEKYEQVVTKDGFNKPTALFENLVPGEYEVVVTSAECITPETPETPETPGENPETPGENPGTPGENPETPGENLEEPTTPPTAIVPPGETSIVPFNETPKEPGELQTPVTFIGGLGCLDDESVTVSLMSEGKVVQAITVDGKTYGVTNGKTIIDGKLYIANVAGKIKIGDKTYTPVTYEQVVTKEADSEVTALFENLVPSNYEVVVSMADCIVPETPANPEEPTTRPSVEVPEGEKVEVPFEEKPKQPGTLQATVNFIGGAGCTENGDVQLQLFAKDGTTAINYIQLDGVKYGVLNDEVIIDEKVYTIKDNSITIDGTPTKVDVKPYIVTIKKTGTNKAIAQFTNLVPAEYVVKAIDTDCVETENPSIDVPPGIPEDPTKVEFNETPKPSTVEVPVQFIGGLGCVENGNVTVTLKDDEGNDVQAVTIEGTKYGISNNQAIIDGKLYNVVVKDGEATFTNVATGKQDEVASAKVEAYTVTITKDGKNQDTAVFENLVAGYYTAVVANEQCIVPTEPTNSEDSQTPIVNVPPGETGEIPFEEMPEEPSNIEVPVTFIGGAGCLEDGAITVALKDAQGNDVQVVTVNGEQYGVTNNEVIVEGKAYKVEVVEGKATFINVATGEKLVAGKEVVTSDVAVYKQTVTKSGAATETAVFENLVRGEYTVVVEAGECIVPTEPTSEETPETPEEPTTNVNVPPGETSKVPFNETPKEPGNVEASVTFIEGFGCTEAGDVTLALKDAEGNDVKAVEIDGKQYGIANNQVIVNDAVYTVVVKGDQATFTNVVTGKQLVEGDKAVTSNVTVYTKTVTKDGSSTETALFENLVPGDYTVVVENNECIVPADEKLETPGTSEEPGNSENPENPTSTVTVPPGKTEEVPFEEKPTPSTVEVPVTFASGNGCLEDGAEVTVTLLTKDGKAVTTITAQDGTVYGVANNEAIIDGKVVAVEISEGATTVTVNGADYTVGTAVQTVAKEASTTVNVVFENLVPGEYTVVVEAGECIVPSELTNDENAENQEEPTTNVDVPPGKTEEVPFEEKTPEEEQTPSTVEVPVTFADGNGCLENGEEVTVTLQDKDGNTVQTITAQDGTVYGVYNNEAIIGGKVVAVEISEGATTVTVNGADYTVGTAVQTVAKEASTTVNVVFENLVPGEYTVVVEASECIVPSEPTNGENPENPEGPTTNVNVPPGKTGNVPFEEKTPEACDELVTVPVEEGTTITVNGNEYTDENNDGKVEVPAADVTETTSVTDEEGNEIGTIVVEEGECPIFTAKPEACDEVVTVPVEEGTTITVNGNEYTDENNDGKIEVP